MIYFCADDYGMSCYGNSRIEDCLKNGVLNKVSILLNGEIEDFKNRLSENEAKISLHINLIEGRPLSDLKDVGLLTDNNGYFRYSFAGLFFLSLSFKRKEFERQIYKEIQSQVKFFKEAMGEDRNLSIDSHQHVHMIPLIFKVLLRVIKDEGLTDATIRIPAEPISPYILTPSLYFKYSLTGCIKQWVLKTLAFINRKEIKKLKIKPAYFVGIMFSGKFNEEKIKKILPRYLKLAKKNNRDIEFGFHPGFVEKKEDLICGSRKSFNKFYFSLWRKTEYNTLLNIKF